MPLLPGKSKRVIQANTQMLIHEGRNPKQAYAIANSNARKGRKTKTKRKKKNG